MRGADERAGGLVRMTAILLIAVAVATLAGVVLG